MTGGDWITSSSCGESTTYDQRKLKNGDRVALLGRGIAVVKQADEKEAGLVLGNGELLRVARKDIVLNQQSCGHYRSVFTMAEG